MLRPPVNPPYSSKAEELIEALRRRKADWPSEPGLQNIGPRTTDELLDIVSHEKAQYGQDQWGAVFVLLLVLFATGIAYAKQTMLPLVPAFALLSAILGKSKDKQRYAVYALACTDDLRVLQTLILATRSSWGCHPQVIAAIERLLKQVTVEHVGLLNSDAQYRLGELAVTPIEYQTYYNEPLAMRTLHALTAIGNRDTLVRMQHLARQTAKRSAHGRIIEAVQELLPIMEARLKLQEIPDTLLRAADTPTSTSETLLRPALVVTPEPPEQLLRASMGEEREA